MRLVDQLKPRLPTSGVNTSMSFRIPFIDPRYYQIAVLSTLVIYGTTALGFGIRWDNALAIAASALATQYLATRLLSRTSFDPLSAIITSLSLTLLFRTDVVAIAALAGIIAIGSKFLLRVRGKHVFNPANIAIVTLMFGNDHAWISSGQWGSATISAVLLIGLGLLVLTRAKRSETTVGFLAAYSTLLLLRALWLGDPLSIPMHQLQNGALLVFAFFMISDPKTTPDSRAGRVAFAMLVALGAAYVHFVLFRNNGLLWSLIAMAPAVPLIDWLSPGERYRWRSSTSLPSRPEGQEVLS